MSVLPQTPEGLKLVEDESGLWLTDGNLKMQGDFTKLLPRLKKGRIGSEMLVKASKVGQLGDDPLAIDATAGMGEDSLILAAAGFRVRLYESDPVIAALLSDTVRRALQIPELEEIVSRMEVIEADSIKAMREYSLKEGRGPELILLDPMFPARSKSGLIKKKFQLLQQLEKPCTNEEELLDAALLAKAQRIIIKRPAKGPFLAGRKPDYSLDGKAIRYDVVLKH